jgi:hypothetical protein
VKIGKSSRNMISRTVSKIIHKDIL